MDLFETHTSMSNCFFMIAHTHFFVYGFLFVYIRLYFFLNIICSLFHMCPCTIVQLKRKNAWNPNVWPLKSKYQTQCARWQYGVTGRHAVRHAATAFEFAHVFCWSKRRWKQNVPRAWNCTNRNNVHRNSRVLSIGLKLQVIMMLLCTRTCLSNDKNIIL